MTERPDRWTDVAPDRARIVLGILLALALAVRLAFFTGFVGSDDAAYLRAASDLAEHQRWTGHSHFSSRIGFVAATAVAIGVLGRSELGTVAVSLLASLLTHLLVYRLGRVYCGTRAALLAVALLAFYPLDVWHASILVPEPLLACLMAAGLVTYEWARRGGGREIGGSPAAGALLGGAYLVKEPGALLLGALAVIWVISALRVRRIESTWIAVLLGFLAIVGVEAGLHYWATGAPFARYQMTDEMLTEGIALSGAAFGHFFSWTVYFRTMFFSIYPVGLLFYLLVAALAWAVFRRAPMPATLVLWLVVVLGYMSVGSASLTRYVPLPKQPRYLEAITVPAVILTAGALAHWLARPRTWSRRVAAGLLAGYVAVGLLCAHLTSSLERHRFEPIRLTARVLKEKGLTPVFASQRMANGLYELSGAAWNARPVIHGCGARRFGAHFVWAVSSGYHGPLPDRPGGDCGGWTPAAAIDVSGSNAPPRALGAVRGLLDRAPLPHSLTAKIYKTLTRHVAHQVIYVFVVAERPPGESADGNPPGGPAPSD